VRNLANRCHVHRQESLGAEGRFHSNELGSYRTASCRRRISGARSAPLVNRAASVRAEEGGETRGPVREENAHQRDSFHAIVPMESGQSGRHDEL